MTVRFGEQGSTYRFESVSGQTEAVEMAAEAFPTDCRAPDVEQ